MLSFLLVGWVLRAIDYDGRWFSVGRKWPDSDTRRLPVMRRPKFEWLSLDGIPVR